MISKLIYVCLIYQYSIQTTVSAMKCGKEDGSTVTCPMAGDPADYTRCCWNQTLLMCCPQPHSDLLSHHRNVMIAGITVITICILVSVLIVICCFWSRCPLFKMCRINYTHSEILTYSKEEEAMRMPAERPEGCHHYTPCHVIIKPLEDL